MIEFEIRPSRSQTKISQTPFHQYVFSDDTVWTEFFRLGEDYLLRFPTLADFEVSADGTQVIAYPTESVDENTIEHLYINQLVPLAMSRQGHPAYHASVVTVADGAIAFIGESGAGKSTLAASFSLNGATFLTDDALIIDETESGCFVQPSHASLRLWEDSVDALISAGNLRANPVSYSTKTRLLAGKALNHCNQPKPLVAAYILEDCGVEETVIRKRSGIDRYMGWLGNSFLLDIEDHGLLRQHFDWTHRISGATPTFSLDYPREYGMLPLVQDILSAHSENLGP